MRVADLTLCDTTLRDGEQAPGVVFPSPVKLALARLLDDAGVGEIEAGTPVCGGDEFEAVRLIASAGLKARVSGWCRAREEDVDAALACGVGAVAIAIPSSEIQLRQKLGQSAAWAGARVAAAVSHAKGKGLYVIAAMEDASRASREALTTLIGAMADAGADRIRVSDTVGVLDPFGTVELVDFARKAGNLPVEFHGHNDFGMATANSLAAARAGASHLSVTVLGLGERAGNAALEEVAFGLALLRGIGTGARLEKLRPLCEAVAEASGRPIPVGKPFAGADLFTHEAGIHADGVLKHPSTYEPYGPELIGATRRIVLGKHSGRGAVRARLAALGFFPEGPELLALTELVRKKAIGGEDFGDVALLRLLRDGKAA